MSASPWHIFAEIEPDEVITLVFAAAGFGLLAWWLYAFTTEELDRGFHLSPASGEEWMGLLGRAVLLLFLAIAFTCRLPGRRWFGFALSISREDLLHIVFWLLFIFTPFCASKQRGVIIFMILGLIVLALLFPAISMDRN